MLRLNLNTTLASTLRLVLSSAACTTDNAADASDETTASSDAADDAELDADAVAAFEASSACALAALRDGAPGHLSWTLDQNGGQFSEHGSRSLFGDATVRIAHGGTVDLCTYEDDAASLDGAELRANSTAGYDCSGDPVVARGRCVLDRTGVTVTADPNACETSQLFIEQPTLPD